MRAALPILAIATAFLAFSAATLDDFGLTWDEGVKMHDDARYRDAVQRIAPSDPRVLHIPGYFYVVDTLRSLFAKAARDALPGADPVLVHHAFNALLSTACLVLLHGLVVAIGAGRRVAAIAAIALALMPKFLGHSQNNPKDLPAAVLFLAVAWAFVALVRAPRLRTAVAAAALFGVALTTRISAVLLAPILLGWAFLRRRDALRGSWRFVAGAGAASIGFALLSFPALWVHGAAVFRVAAKRYETLRGLDVKVLYLGELHRWDALPWHYSGVHLLVSLPLAHLFFLALAVPALRSWQRTAPRRADAGWLAVGFVAVLFGVDLLAPLHYDGVRHLLAALPMVAVLVACGAAFTLERLEEAFRGSRIPRIGAVVPIALLAAITAAELASVHPYQTAYLNPIARAIAGDDAQDWIEVEYWGAPYKEGSAWLDRHAEPDAVVHFVIGGGQRAGEDVSRYYLDRRVVRGGSLRVFENEAVPQYLMFVTRRAWYDDFVNEVRARYEPVFRVRRQDATLLEIYSNRVGRRP